MTDLEKVSDLDNLLKAFYKSRTDVEWKNSVQTFEQNLLLNLMDIQSSLLNGTYKQGPFFEFTLSERGKVRHIKALSIRDRIVQRSLCDNVLMPAVKKYLIYDNGASVKDKGVTFSRNRIITHLEKYMRQYGTEGYILQIDFSNFFGTIPHKEVIDMLESKLKDSSTFPLIEHIIHSFNDNGVGLGIGSQISQICGILYVTPLDNYCKIVKQMKYYGRYMDDLYVIHHDKEELKQLLNEILVVVKSLKLVINPRKTRITKLTHGFTFLQIKYNILPNKKILQRLSSKSITRERRKIKKYRKLVNNNQMTFLEVQNAYKSWKEDKKKFSSYNSIKNLNCLFDKLFIDGGYYGE